MDVGRCNIFALKRINAFLLVVNVLFMGLLAGQLEGRPQQGRDYVDDQVIVKLRPGIQKNDTDILRSAVNASVARRFSLTGAELWNVSKGSVDNVLKLYESDPRFEYVEPNYIVTVIQATPNDPSVGQLWGLNNVGQTGGIPDADIDAPEAWEIETGKDVIVGVIDTGVDWQHEDLADNIWLNPGEIANNGIDDDGNGFVDDVRGWDFVNDDNNPFDDNGHGTHVSGTIAAVGDNNTGVVGVCWSAKIMPLKFLGSGGSGDIADAILALEYATMMGARLTSNSWGGGPFSQAMFDAVEAAQEAGLLFVAAAGNDGLDNDFFPQFPSGLDLDNVIAVAATTHNDSKSSFSNFGLTSVDIAAPGSDIFSTLPGNRYGSLNGTSMATPHVSGVVALLWSHQPELTAAQVKERILKSADPLPTLQGKVVSGGRLNAANALSGPDSTPPSAVDDLAVDSMTSESITLIWTARGDDGSAGTASSYDLRFSKEPISESNFRSADQVQGLPKPQPAGSAESFTVAGLDFDTLYHFAVKVIDDWGNSSALSNLASARTLGAPAIAVSPPSLEVGLSDAKTATRTIEIGNEGAGTLSFEIVITRGSSTSSQSMQKLASDQSTLRDESRILEILSANERIHARAVMPLTAEDEATRLISTTRLSAKQIWSKRQNVTSNASEPIYAAVLDGVGTRSTSLLMWDELNARWPEYGSQEILIDYSTFNAKEITYEELTEVGPDLLIISDNWNPTHEYGPFSEAEVKAIARYVEDGAGLYISAGTFNNGEFPELQPQIDFLAPLVGLSANEAYFWNGNSYGALNFETQDHPILKNVTEPFRSGWTDKTLVPSSGSWGPGVVPDGKILGLSDNGETALIVNRNRVFHAGLPEHEAGTEADKQFIYNVISQSGGRPLWLTVEPLIGTVFAGNRVEISAKFDATALQAGSYTAGIVVNSNDPTSPSVEIPVTLTVAGGGGQPGQLTASFCESDLQSISGSRDTVFVCMSDVTGEEIVSYQMVVTFDESVIDAVAATSAGTISEGFGQPVVNLDVDGQVSIGGFGTVPLSGSGPLVGIIFDVVGSAGSTASLCLQSLDFNSGQPAVEIPDPCIPVEISDGTVQTHRISGNVRYGITAEPVPAVTMSLTGGVSESVDTGTDGAYDFQGLPGGSNYTLTLSKVDDINDEAISCFDGALVAQNAVGLIEFTEVQSRAGDVDEDGFIFTFDAAMICRNAVGLPSLNEKEQTGQWRFEPGTRFYTPLSDDVTGEEELAILLGDVDGSWTTTISSSKQHASAQADMPALISTSSGDTISVPFGLDGSERVFSVDLELQFDPEVLKFVAAEQTSLARELNLVNNLEPGRLRLGMFGGHAVEDAGILFNLLFEVIGKEGQESDVSLVRYQLNGGSIYQARSHVEIRALTAQLPEQFTLSQNYPNPFNPQTSIHFDIPKNNAGGKVYLAVYNSTGKLVRLLLNEERSPGSYQVEWNGKNDAGKSVASGVYIYTFRSGDFIATKKMILLR